MRRFLILLILLATGPAQAQGPSAALDIYSDPPGATVALNHQLLGHTPLRVAPLPPGDYQLRLAGGEDYRPYLATVRVQPGLVQRLDIRLEPSTGLLLRQGIEAARAHSDQEAMELLERAAQESPSQGEAWGWLGWVQMRQGLDEKAVASFRACARRFPDRPDAYLHLGVLHEQAGRRAQAVTAYKMALLRSERLRGALSGAPAATWADIARAGQPTSPEGQLRLGWMYEQKGRMDLALRWLRAAADQVFASAPSPAPSPAP
jgi:tetratricopeptide (TPR) repeat protein